MKYLVRLEKFEGPLDLLLELIEKEKLDITEVSLSKVASQYLDFLKKTEVIDPENIADFLVVAAKLVLIKSKALLPFLELTKEEEEEIADLQQQLHEYQLFREAARKIRKLYSQRKVSFSREGYLGVNVTFYPPKDLKVQTLRDLMWQVVASLPILEKLPQEVVKRVVSLEEKFGEIQKRVQEGLETSFTKLTETADSKIDIIVSFLALLELIKQKIVLVEQDGLFKEIKIKKYAEKPKN